VRTSAVGLLEQFTLSKRCYDDVVAASKVTEQVRALRDQLRKAREQAGAGPVADRIAAFEKKLTEIAGATGGGGRGGGGGGRGAVAGGPDTVASVSATLGVLMRSIESADVAPTTQAVAAVTDRRAALAKLMARFAVLKTHDLSDLNLPQ
jgi:hypothetical protein